MNPSPFSLEIPSFSMNFPQQSSTGLPLPSLMLTNYSVFSKLFPLIFPLESKEQFIQYWRSPQFQRSLKVLLSYCESFHLSPTTKYNSFVCLLRLTQSISPTEWSDRFIKGILLLNSKYFESKHRRLRISSFHCASKAEKSDLLLVELQILSLLIGLDYRFVTIFSFVELFIETISINFHSIFSLQRENEEERIKENLLQLSELLLDQILFHSDPTPLFHSKYDALGAAVVLAALQLFALTQEEDRKQYHAEALQSSSNPLFIQRKNGTNWNIPNKLQDDNEALNQISIPSFDYIERLFPVSSTPSSCSDPPSSEELLNSCYSSSRGSGGISPIDWEERKETQHRQEEWAAGPGAEIDIAVLVRMCSFCVSSVSPFELAGQANELLIQLLGEKECRKRNVLIHLFSKSEEQWKDIAQQAAHMKRCLYQDYQMV